MPRSVTLGVLFLLWFIAFVAAFIAYQTTPPSGDGFTAGLNRIGGFLAWQLVAAVLSIIIWMRGQKLLAGTWTRRLTRLPLLLFILPAIGFVLVLIWALNS